MKKLILIPLVVAAAGCGSQTGATSTVTAPAKTVTQVQTETVYKTPQSCITALFGMKHVGELELKALKHADNMDWGGATVYINQATAQVNKTIKPFKACISS